MLLGSDIHDNPGAGLILRAGGVARIAHSAFGRNGSSEQATAALVIEPGARPTFHRNVFHSVDPLTFGALDELFRTRLKNDNWFPDARPMTPAAGRGRGRGQ